MTKPNSKQGAGQNQNQNQKQTGRELVQDKSDVRHKAGGDADPLTGAGDRPASGYPEHNPRPEQQQTGGGVDQNEVGDDLAGDEWEADDLESDDWEGDERGEPDGDRKHPNFYEPQTGNDVDPDGPAKPLRF